MALHTAPHDAQVVSDAKACINDMYDLLLACENDFRRRPHQNMGLPQAMKKIQQALKSPEPDSIREQIGRWHALKKCRSLIAVDQKFQSVTAAEHRTRAKQDILSESSGRSAKSLQERGRQQQTLYNNLRLNTRVQVDVVNHGHEWLQVRLLQPKRLAMQMSESGWSWESHTKGCAVSTEEWEDISLTKRLRLLIAAAKMNPHEYRTPRIRLVLPLIGRINPDFDILFDQFANMDSEVQVIIEDKDSTFLTQPAPPDFVSKLMGDPLENLTPTLILEHTVLVDLISDLTHCHLEPQPWQVGPTRAQIEEENRHQGGWMIKWLYPVLAGRKLLITEATANHLYEILETVGTATEQERASLLVPKPGATRAFTNEEARLRFKALSAHQLPDNVQLPVEVDSKDWLSSEIVIEAGADRIPQSAVSSHLAELFSIYTISTILSAWASGNTIVTSNKEIKGLVRKLVERVALPSEAATGPTVHTLLVARYMLSSHAKPRPECS